MDDSRHAAAIWSADAALQFGHGLVPWMTAHGRDRHHGGARASIRPRVGAVDDEPLNGPWQLANIELQFGHGLVPWMTTNSCASSRQLKPSLQFGHGLVPWMTVAGGRRRK